MSPSSDLAQDGRDLLLAEFAALRSDLIRDFMRGRVRPLDGSKEQLVSRVADAIADPDDDLTWEMLVRYLDQVGPNDKQHVILLSTDEAQSEEWTSEQPLLAVVRQGGHEAAWQQELPLIAPEALQPTSVTMADGLIQVAAVAARSFDRRRKDLERDDLIAGENLVARVFETVTVRSWVRLRWRPATGEASLHIRQLPSERLYRDTYSEFWELLEGWFPIQLFQELPLGKAVAALDKLEEEGTAEARVQAREYLSKGGLRSSVRSATASQPVHGETERLDVALTTFRESGQGASGNFYFLPAPAGPAANPLSREIHVTLVVKENRINFPRPVGADELEHVLRRIRVLAS